MNLNRFPAAVALISGLLGLGSAVDAAQGPAATVSAAQTFLATLDAPMRAKAVFTFGDQKQRANWSNLPTGIYQRAGVRFGDLTPAQRESLMTLLATTLSKSGYEKVRAIMEGDETLRSGGSGKLAFGRDEFYVSILGTPSLQEPWMIQFGGHHLALNITLAGDKGTLAPSHTAAQPARFSLDGKNIRALGEETDLAFSLINALEESQRKQAVLGAKFRDLVLGPGQEIKPLVPEGVKVSTFNEKQRTLLLQLIRQWVGILPDDAANPKMEEIKAGLAETWFAWSGPTTPGSAAYFRIQGPAVWIELAPQNLGGDATQHIHTIYRDPTNEYGRKWWKP